MGGSGGRLGCVGLLTELAGGRGTTLPMHDAFLGKRCPCPCGPSSVALLGLWLEQGGCPMARGPAEPPPRQGRAGAFSCGASGAGRSILKPISVQSSAP